MQLPLLYTMAVAMQWKLHTCVYNVGSHCVRKILAYNYMYVAMIINYYVQITLRFITLIILDTCTLIKSTFQPCIPNKMASEIKEGQQLIFLYP